MSEERGVLPINLDAAFGVVCAVLSREMGTEITDVRGLAAAIADALPIAQVLPEDGDA